MNEAETRAELIDPWLKRCGWGEVGGSRILRERDVCKITDGRIQVGGGRKKPLIADYILVYKGIKLAVVEAKSDELEVGEGVAQAKLYASKLNLYTTYSTNGKDIYRINMDTGQEGLVSDFMSPDELWERTFPKGRVSDISESWREKFATIPNEGSYGKRFYQEIAIRNTMEAIAKNQKRILLTLATGTGKTTIAFQIAWKLFQSRWNLTATDPNTAYKKRQARILFLADRNILADQAFNSFSAFPEDSMVRIKPKEIRKKGKVPTNGSIFFTIFQTFMSGTDKDGNPEPYFGEYPRDYFDFIVIDECHRGGANDESNWRAIMEYFSPAVQLGLTATPKRDSNIDTYRYFGDPVYVYSLKEGIEDGFLTPFKVKRIKTTLDDYIYTSDDTIVEGEIEKGKRYEESDFNRIIEIKEREAKRVKIFMNQIGQKEKSIVFCATQAHAAAVRDLVNQNHHVKLGERVERNYCVRVTANDGELGEQYLREFQDNEKNIPTILTTSQKLSTGIDARNIRNIILMRPVNSMIEFKQIVGRGTRLFDGKEFFTIYDFVDAHHHFSDPEWDGEPLPPEEPPGEPGGSGEPPSPPYPGPISGGEGGSGGERPQKIKIKLRDGKEREIQHMIQTSFWSADGKPISAEEFLQDLFGELPNFFKTEEELREIWSDPKTRKVLLNNLNEAGFGHEELSTLQKLINAEKSDLYDVLEYVFNSDRQPITRENRVLLAEKNIYDGLNGEQREFVKFILSNYIKIGVEELSQDKLPTLCQNYYGSLEDATRLLGGVESISSMFVGLQKYLYEVEAVG